MNLHRRGIPLPPPRPPMILLATFTVLISLSFLGSSRSHELCLDFTFPSDAAQTDDALSTSLLRCRAWESERICSPDRSVADQIDALGLLPGSTCLDDFMAPMLCSILDAWSAHLYDEETGTVRSVPYLCGDFASGLYDACETEEMSVNPFLSDIEAANAVDVYGPIVWKYPTKESFVSDFAVINEDESYCFSGGPYVPQPPGQVDSPLDMCVERLSELDLTRWGQVNQNEVWIQFESVPGFPGIVALGSHNGYVGIYRVNDFGTAPTKLSTLIDMSGFVHQPISRSDERGLLGMAFHKEFKTNGRVFMSYSCARNQFDRCGEWGDTAIEEFHVPGTTNPDTPLVVDETRPVKVIFKYSQDRGNHNGAPILFRPTDSDPYLYILLGDGGGAGDPKDRSQDVSSLLGKALRIDIDSDPPEGSTYVIPPTNPFVSVPAVQNEIYAIGLRNPWKASFDPLNPTYFYVADVGQGKMEEIDLLVKGSNFGWPRFEGTRLYSEDRALASEVNSHRPPVATYTHSYNNAGGKASVTGGYVVRTKVDPSLTGSYVFADLYDRIYVTTETPVNSGQFTNPTRIEPLCSRNSPFPCTSGTQNYIMTFGVDSYQNVYFVSEKGLHRLVPPCLCAQRNCTGVKICLDQSMVLKASGTVSPTDSPTDIPSVGSSRLPAGVAVQTDLPSSAPTTTIDSPTCPTGAADPPALAPMITQPTSLRDSSAMMSVRGNLFLAVSGAVNVFVVLAALVFD